jgi:GntR family transcriptional regulator
MAQQQQPMYQRVVEGLRNQIESGELPRESQLPSDPELSRKYDVSPSTVRQAIKRLVSQGLLETRQGQGTFVARKIEPFVTDLTPDPRAGIAAGGEAGRTYPATVTKENRRVTPPEVTVLPCPADIAERLKIRPGSQVISRSQKRYIDDTLWSLQFSYYPFAWATKGADRLLMAEDIEQGTIGYLAETLELAQAGYQDSITARPAKDEEQRGFGLPTDAAMFVTFRTAFAEDETAIRVTVTICPADRNQFRYSYGKVPSSTRDQQWSGVDY